MRSRMPQTVHEPPALKRDTRGREVLLRACGAGGPVLSNTGHDADAYGANEGIPLARWRPERRCGISLPPTAICDTRAHCCTCGRILVVSARCAARDLLQLRRRAPHDRGLSQPTAYDR